MKSPANKVRLGIVGLGNIGRFHAQALLAGHVPRCELGAICTRQAKPELPALFAGNLFNEPDTMIRSGCVDALLIANPHPQHAAVGQLAFGAGLHVMMEKPIASHKREAEILVAGHAQHPGCVFAAMFQFRAEPHFQEMRRIIQGGELGDLVRVSWINTDWFRPEAYYQSSAWRATWQGEGGGVLINQCLHNLDMLQWLVGMPSRLRGFCTFGRFHQIEVEDDVTCYLEWANGANGTFISSTGETPGTNRLEISGTRGRLLWEGGKLWLSRNRVDAREFCQSATRPFERLESTTEELVVPKVEHPHAMLLQNFTNAILDGEPLIAPGIEGINSLELANAMVLSSVRGQTVEMPLDGAVWEAELARLSEVSAAGKRTIRNISGDVGLSFSR
jgi:predicted dehydrogenase